MTFVFAAVCSHAVRGSGSEAEGGVDLAAAQRHFDAGLKLFEAARSYQREHPSDRAGAAERYRAAAKKFVAAWQAGVSSTEVYTNAANSFAFAGDQGRAVLFYRRALAADPSNSVARGSLEAIRSKLPIRRQATSAASGLLSALFFWHEGVSFRVRRLAFSVTFTAGFLLLALSLKWRRAWRWMGILCVVVGLFLLGSLVLEATTGSIRSAAVVQVQVQGRRGDGATYSPSHNEPFPPGTEVNVLEERTTSGGERWLRVRLLDGSESWLTAGCVERVIAPQSGLAQE